MFKNLHDIKKLYILYVFGLLSNTIYSQSRFGIEVSFARLETRNAGQLLGSYEGFYLVHEERDPVNSSYSIGLSYQLFRHHLIKLSMGRHHNGRIIDITTYDDLFGGQDIHYTDIYAFNQYFQIKSSYAYRILVNKLIVPLEAGLNINRRINIEDTKFVGVRSMNYDLSISAGVGYVVTDYLSAAISVVYNHALNEYQTMYEDGTFKPRQFGLEISLMYQLDRNQKSE